MQKKMCDWEVAMYDIMLHSDDSNHSFLIFTLNKIFCVYKAGTQGPFVVLIHGAGYTALTWSLCIVRIIICTPI